MTKNICAPNSKNKYSCFNISSLKKIAKKINNDNRYNNYKNININKFGKDNKKKFVKEIQKKLNCNQNLDFCILKKESDFYKEIKQTIKPKGPQGYEWLSSLDILNVMEQYEKKYKNFDFLGPFPIDFADLYKEMENFNLKRMTKQKKKIGVVFNTDPSWESGEHWISMFLDMENKTLCFFDSVGDKPPKEVWRLMKKIEKQSRVLKCPIKIIVNKKQFQFDNSSCGIWSLYFIIQRLKGTTCNTVFNSKVSDKLMYKKRKQYFR